mmetsp:Transcript_78836/g.189204  ORF Transcript_78836/g.189204 Transcript_78836/m.189204 type:complete len:310 (-) Transcript_78836:70-999(-)
MACHAFVLTSVIGCVAVKKDHINGVDEDFDFNAPLAEPLPPYLPSTEAMRDVSLVQVALEVQRSGSGKTKSGDLGKALTEATGAALEVAKDAGHAVHFNFSQVASEAAQAAAQLAKVTWQESEHQAWPANMTAEDTVKNAAAEASSAAQMAKDYATALSHSLEDTSWSHQHAPSAPKADGAQSSSQNDASHRPVVRQKSAEPSIKASQYWAAFLKASANMQESVCNRYVLLRISILLAGCFILHLLRWGLHPVTQGKAAASAVCNKVRHAQPFGANRDSSSMPSGHPDLYEPSSFHEDRDRRRVVTGGE